MSNSSSTDPVQTKPPPQDVIEQQMSRPSAVKRFIDFFGLRRSIVGLLSMVVLVGMGEHMAEQFLPLYLVALGGGFISVGFLNGMDNLLGALYAFPGGYLSDRFGTKRALLFFNIVSMIGFTIVIFVQHWLAVLMAAALFLSWTAISLPATMSLVARVLPKNKRTMGVSVHSLVRRIPMALGPIVGGLFIALWGLELGIRLAFVAALLMAVVAAVFQQLLIENDPPRDAAKETPNPMRLWRHMSADLRKLLVSDILVRFCEQIPYAFVVIWAVGTPDNPGPINTVQFGLLRTVEMATAILIYVPVAWLADRGRKKPFVIMTFIFFTLFPVMLYFSRSFPMLIAAFVLRGLKEFGEPTRKALIMDLAPEEHKAGMFGLYYLIRDVIVSIAAFGGAFLWSHSPQLNLFTAAAFGAIGTLWFVLQGRDLGPPQPAPQQAPRTGADAV
jgi:MFS family permease